MAIVKTVDVYFFVVFYICNNNYYYLLQTNVTKIWYVTKKLNYYKIKEYCL